MLSKCIFDLLIFTLVIFTIYPNIVVICFQNVSLTYWYSLIKVLRNERKRLWFAFKMYLWLIDIHSIWAKWAVLIVVICFQNVSLTYWYSLNLDELQISYELWFAFKMYLWLIDIHSFSLNTACLRRCDLLSKCIFDLLIFTVLNQNTCCAWLLVNM